MKFNKMLVAFLTICVVGAGATLSTGSQTVHAETVYSWVRGTWHNKHYIFKITKETVRTKNRYTGTYRKYRIHDFIGTHDVCYIFTSHGYHTGFTVEGLNNKLYIGKFHGTYSGHPSAFIKSRNQG